MRHTETYMKRQRYEHACDPLPPTVQSCPTTKLVGRIWAHRAENTKGKESLICSKPRAPLKAVTSTRLYHGCVLKRECAMTMRADMILGKKQEMGPTRGQDDKSLGPEACNNEHSMPATVGIRACVQNGDARHQHRRSMPALRR